MLEKCTRWYPLMGRLFMGALFVMSGFQKFTAYEQTVGFIGSAGLPVPELLAILVIALEVLGGLALVFGFKFKQTATVLFTFVLAATLIFHTNFEDPMQMGAFLKNLAIMGGLAYMMAYGAGAYAMKKHS